jgi:hypothetical protein
VRRRKRRSGSAIETAIESIGSTVITANTVSIGIIGRGYGKSAKSRSTLCLKLRRRKLLSLMQLPMRCRVRSLPAGGRGRVPERMERTMRPTLRSKLPSQNIGQSSSHRRRRAQPVDFSDDLVLASAGTLSAWTRIVLILPWYRFTLRRTALR